MLILAIDGSGKSCSCALLAQGQLLGESFLNSGLTHSETLLPMITQLLAGARVSLSQIDRIAVTAGPGSFTGLRIAIATAKGLAFAHDTPCTQVSTLEALAVLTPPGNAVISPVLDARRQQVYNALFSWESGHLRRECEDRALSIDQLVDELADAPVLFTGDAVPLLQHAAADRCRCAQYLPQHAHLTRALGAGLLAQEREGVSHEKLAPIYLRLPQAERERLEREQVAFRAQGDSTIV